MLLLSNAKINLGLHVLSKRSDGFHNIETIMLPVGLCDILEIVKSNEDELRFSNSGIQIDCAIQDNLCIKAFNLLKNDFDIPFVKIHLHKNIPHGAGLGGGSSNAAFMLRGLNDLFQLGLDTSLLENYAGKLGSDCSFFIRNKPAIATGRGEVIKEIKFSTCFYLVLLNPNIHVSTKAAYNEISPMPDAPELMSLINTPESNWKNTLHNHFEKSVFKRHPQLQLIKNALYENGAFYAAMSGSGSTMYGLFESKRILSKYLEDIKLWSGLLGVG
jgi:4-diphosphocytidyl-2-C-methyl-D-erythritol kinase